MAVGLLKIIPALVKEAHVWQDIVSVSSKASKRGIEQRFTAFADCSSTQRSTSQRRSALSRGSHEVPLGRNR